MISRKRSFPFLCILAVCLLIPVTSCSRQKLPIKEISIERDGQKIASVKAEIADTQEARNNGLMFRKKLPDGQAMLFVFDYDHVLSFWMKNTYIPLSIAFITHDGVIIDIKDMYPNDTSSVLSSRSARYALEAPQGWFSRAGVRVGDTVVIP
ncbi:DUF192 domain-containing protein [Treponema sp. R6D11]